MFFNQNSLEEKIEQTDKKLTQLEIDVALLDEQAEKLFAEMGVTSQQVELLCGNPAAFTKEDWEHLQEMRLQREQTLERDLSNVTNPLKLKKTYAARKVEQHWLLVK